MPHVSQRPAHRLPHRHGYGPMPACTSNAARLTPLTPEYTNTACTGSATLTAIDPVSVAPPTGSVQSVPQATGVAGWPGWNTRAYKLVPINGTQPSYSATAVG